MKDAKIEYADIIDRSHHVSRKRAPMSPLARAAQFSPFAALTGYDDLIAESARWTQERSELDESEKERLDRVLRFLFQTGAPADITWFIPDARKRGGAYRTERGTIDRYDGMKRSITLSNGQTIPIDEISDIASDAFERAAAHDGLEK